MNLRVAEGEPRVFLRDLFDAAVAAAQPSLMLKEYLPARPKGRVVVVGAGKAAAAMAAACEAAIAEAWGMTVSGLVVTAYGHVVPTAQIEVVAAAHPVPDAAGLVAAQRIMQRVQGLTADDLVLVLLSGGGSALLSLPAAGISLADKQQLHAALLKSGAAIAEINVVRKHLSSIKGGRLAIAAYPALVHSLIISDVPGDEISSIASGPTVADPSDFAQARAILARYEIDVPQTVARHLTLGVAETPKPGDPRLENSVAQIVASPQLSLIAAAKRAMAQGIKPLILSSMMEGEARVVGQLLAGVARQVQQFGQPASSPCVLLSGGETSVTVKGQGLGGRNVEFLLSLAIALNGTHDIWALAADTDGIDGFCSVAGGVITPDSLLRARALQLDPMAYLQNNDAHSFFAKLNDQVITGPTLTNVNDFRAILVMA